MKNILLFLAVLWMNPALSQSGLDEPMEQLRLQYNEPVNLKCNILIQVDVEGMNIPDKKVFVEFRGDEKPKVQGEGLSLLPKKGMVDQFRKLLNSSMQAIFLSKRGHHLVYKLVSLDSSSDWITADLVFDEGSHLIYESVVNTRKFGTFTSKHSYSDHIYPDRSEVTFDVKKVKLPLKFIGSEQRTDNFPAKDENVKGKIILSYTYLDL